MKNLHEYNSEKWDTHMKSMTYPQPNGLACPKCDHEMEDTDDGILLSNPPKKNVRCPSCGYTDYRFA